MERADVGVIQAGDRTRLAIEAVRELRESDFDCDLPAQPGIERAVDDPHAAGVETFFDMVRPDERPRPDRGRCRGVHLRLELRQGLTVGEETLHLKPQLAIAVAHTGQILRAIHGLVLARTMEDLFETLPAFGVHARPDASTPGIVEFRLSRLG